jgi:hypothetical protein
MPFNLEEYLTQTKTTKWFTMNNPGWNPGKMTLEIKTLKGFNNKTLS